MGGIAAAIPSGVRAQQAPLIRYLATIPLSQHEGLMAAFRRGMEQAGFVDGRNVRIEYRSADGRTERLPMLAAEFPSATKLSRLAGMGRGALPQPWLPRPATSNIPVIFTAGDADPVQAGLVQSLSRPGGNVTGFSFLGGMLGAKRLEILRELVPRAEVIGMLVNPLNQTTEIDRRELEAAIVGGRQRLVPISVGPNGDIASAFAASEKIEALVVTADPTFTSRRTELAVLTARLGIPAIYQWDLFVQAGRLIGSEPSLQTDMVRQVFTLRECSREKSPPICRYCNRRSLFFQSTSRQPRRSG